MIYDLIFTNLDIVITLIYANNVNLAREKVLYNI